MKLYFQCGKNKRLAINTTEKTYNNNFCYLGGWKTYIKVNSEAYNDILTKAKIDGYTYTENF